MEQSKANDDQPDDPKVQPTGLMPADLARTEMRAEVRDAAEHVWAKQEAGLRYLVDR